MSKTIVILWQSQEMKDDGEPGEVFGPFVDEETASTWIDLVHSVSPRTKGWFYHVSDIEDPLVLLTRLYTGPE